MTEIFADSAIKRLDRLVRLHGVLPKKTEREIAAFNFLFVWAFESQQQDKYVFTDRRVQDYRRLYREAVSAERLREFESRRNVRDTFTAIHSKAFGAWK